MDPSERRAVEQLKENGFLFEQFDADSLCTHFQVKNVLLQSDIELIHSEKTSIERKLKLLDSVCKYVSFQTLLDGLREQKQGFLAETLECSRDADFISCCDRQGDDSKCRSHLTTLGALEYQRIYIEKSQVSQLSNGISAKLPPLLYTAKAIILYDHTKIIKPYVTDGESVPHKQIKRSKLREQSSAALVEGIHPLDRLTTLFRCSSIMLRQELAKKLSECQFAIPWICQTELRYSFQLMPNIFDGVVVNWKCPCDSVPTERFVSDMPAVIIGTFRVSDNSISKSGVASYLLRYTTEDNHPIFLNRQAPAYMCRCSKLLSLGSIDTFWYLPKEDSKKFLWPIVFMNLHGCAGQFTKQTNLLCTIAHILIVYVNEKFSERGHKKIIKLINNTKAKVVCFVYDFAGVATEATAAETIDANTLKFENMLEQYCSDLIDERDERVEYFNAFTIKTTELMGAKLEEQINKTSKLIEFNELTTLSCCMEIAKTFEFSEHTEKETDNIIAAVNGFNQILMKYNKQDLNLQHLFAEASEMKKESERMAKRPSDQSLNSYYSEIIFQVEANKENRLLIVKEILEQCRHTESAAHTDKYRIQITMLQAFRNACNDTKYFQQFLLYLSRCMTKREQTSLPELWTKVGKFKKELKKQKSAKASAEHLVEIESSISATNQCLRDAAFSITHLLREISQICTIAENLENIDWDFRYRVPGKLAELCSTGYSFEIMNGDAGAIDELWLNKLLTDVAKMIHQHAKVAVVSVLGVQSSGKSTLLNTLFGADFEVGAGRCTRGIFAKLIKTDDELKSQLQCDYLLIVDTEGLRSPEFKGAEQETLRDNEMATFVVGMSDLTIINIKGESDDFSSTLEVAVYAFLRMKLTDYKPWCILVRQGISDVTMFKAKADEAQEQLGKVLDAAIQRAAQNEVDETKKCNYNRFTDVINYDVYAEDQNFFLPPFDGRFSEKFLLKVTALRDGIFKQLKALHDERRSFLTVDEILSRLRRLHSSIAKEDFIFQFYDSQQVESFKKAQSELSKWMWKLNESCLEWKRKQFKNLHKENHTEKQIKDSLTKYVQKECDTILNTNVVNFFKSYDVSKWKFWATNRLQAVLDDQVRFMWNTCKKSIDALQKSADKKETFHDYEKQLVDIAHPHLIALQGKNNQVDLLEEDFVNSWDHWLLRLKQNSDNQFLTSEQIQKIVQEQFEKMLAGKETAAKFKRFFIREYALENDINKVIFGNVGASESNPSSPTTEDIASTIFEKQNQEFEEFVTKSINELNAEFNPLEEQLDDLSEDLLMKIPQKVYENIRAFEEKQNCQILDDLKAIYLYTVYKICCAGYVKLQDQFFQSKRPWYKQLHQDCRPVMFALYKAMAQFPDHATIVGNVLADRIFDAVEKFVKQQVPESAAQALTTFGHAFPKQTTALIGLILLQLGERVSDSISQGLSVDVSQYIEFYTKSEVLIQKFLLASVKETLPLCQQDVMHEVQKLACDELLQVTKALEGFQSLEKGKKWFFALHSNLFTSSNLGINIEHDINLFPETLLVDSNSSNSDFLRRVKLETIRKLKEYAKDDIIVSITSQDNDKAAKMIYKMYFMQGCAVRCSHCGTLCEHPKGHEDLDEVNKHYATHHWFEGFGGKKEDQGHLSIEACSYFQDACARKTWSALSKCNQKDISVYWKWILANCGNQLASALEALPPSIPSKWANLTWPHARESIENDYDVSYKRFRDLFERNFETKLKAFAVVQNDAVEKIKNVIQAKEKEWDEFLNERLVDVNGHGSLHSSQSSITARPKKPLVFLFVGPKGRGKQTMTSILTSAWLEDNQRKACVISLKDFEDKPDVLNQRLETILKEEEKHVICFLGIDQAKKRDCIIQQLMRFLKYGLLETGKGEQELPVTRRVIVIFTSEITQDPGRNESFRFKNFSLQRQPSNTQSVQQKLLKKLEKHFKCKEFFTVAHLVHFPQFSEDDICRLATIQLDSFKNCFLKEYSISSVVVSNDILKLILKKYQAKKEFKFCQDWIVALREKTKELVGNDLKPRFTLTLSVTTEGKKPDFIKISVLNEEGKRVKSEKSNHN